MTAERLERDADALRRSFGADSAQVQRRLDRTAAAESGSLARFGLKSSQPPLYEVVALEAGPSSTVYVRAREPKGPMNGFGYSWLDDRLEQARLPRPALLDRPAPRDGAPFAYEALNLVTGYRSVQMIHDELEWTVGPVPREEVMDYLATLEKLGLLKRKGS